MYICITALSHASSKSQANYSSRKINWIPHCMVSPALTETHSSQCMETHTCTATYTHMRCHMPTNTRRCDTPHHTATHRTILQHTATHGNTLIYNIHMQALVCAVICQFCRLPKLLDSFGSPFLCKALLQKEISSHLTKQNLEIYAFCWY